MLNQKKEKVIELKNRGASPLLYPVKTSGDNNDVILVIAQYEFGIASLLNKKELLQVGDPVQFQVHTTEDFAVNIQATREKLRSNVEAMKGE